MNRSTLENYIKEILKQKKVKEGTCGYDRDAKSGKKFSTPGGMPLKRKSVREDEIKFSKDEMEKLHKDGKLEKGGHSFKYKLNDLEEEFLTPNEIGDEAVEKESASGAFEESINEGLTLTFEFPDERKAKQFDLDIENSAIGVGNQVGNKVTVTDVDTKWRSTVKKYIKNN